MSFHLHYNTMKEWIRSSFLCSLPWYGKGGGTGSFASLSTEISILILNRKEENHGHCCVFGTGRCGITRNPAGRVHTTCRDSKNLEMLQEVWLPKLFETLHGSILSGWRIICVLHRGLNILKFVKWWLKEIEAALQSPVLVILTDQAKKRKLK